MLEKNYNKVIKTKELLVNIIKEPIDYIDSESVKSALKTQESLARYSIKDKEVFGCSLNTFKSASNELLDGGFKEINQLRINALDSIQACTEKPVANKRTRTGLKVKVENLESDLQSIRQSNFLLTLLMSELRGELKRMAVIDESPDVRLSRYKEINKKVEAKLSLISVMDEITKSGICNNCIKIIEGDS
ncbi:TPA: hypothetical protein ACMDXT_000026 [Vibrio parahaemolyticus]